jgi:hypothetical protein
MQVVQRKGGKAIKMGTNCSLKKCLLKFFGIFSAATYSGHNPMTRNVHLNGHLI